MKKLLGILLIGCMVLLAGCSSSQDTKSSGAQGSVKVMKVGSVMTKDRAPSQAFYKFGEIVEKETGGSIKVEVYTDGVLGDDRRTLEGLQLGSIQGTTVSTGPISSFSPAIGVLDLPFLFKDRESAYKLLDGPIGQELLDSLTSSGFIGLCYWENGFRHTTNSKREVTTLEDLKGLKIRTLESPIHVDIWKALGTNPSPISYSQLYTALEQKVVDGQENPLANVQTSKFDEVQKFVTLDGHVYGASPFLVSKVFWDTLTDKEKAAIKKAAIEARDFERKGAAEEDKKAIEYLTSKGVKVSELKPGEKEKMRAALQPVYEKYKAPYAQYFDRIMDATK